MSPPSGAPKTGRLPAAPAGLAGLALLTAAGYSMHARALPAWAAAALALGIGLWVAVAWGGASVPEPDQPFAPDSAKARRLAAGLPLTAALAGFAFWRMRDATFDVEGAVCWIASVATWLWSWTPAAASPRPWRERARPRWTTVALFLVVLAVGVFFRFYDLNGLPRHPHSDHVEDLFNVEDLDAGQRPVFFERNTGQPALPFYWTWLVHRAFGLPLHFELLKISLALISLLAIPAIYLLGRTLGGWPLGIFASAFAAWSMWATVGARRGLTYPFAVFPAALALASLIRWMRTGRRSHALFAGLWLGVGQHGYNAFKAAPLLVPVAVLLVLTDPRWRGRRRRAVGDAFLMAGGAFLVFLPLLDYALQNPHWFLFRIFTRLTGEERALTAPPLVLFGRNLKAMALAFHWRGDGGWITSVIDEPFLDPVSGAFLLAGTVLALAAWRRGSRSWALVILSLPVLTLASSLNLAFPHENPHVTRSAVALPSVMALCALPAAWIAGEAARRRSWRRVLSAAALAAFLALSLRQNAIGYFVRFRAQMTTLLDPVMSMVAVAKEYRGRGVPMENLYLLGWPHWIDSRCLAYELDIPRPLEWNQTHDVWPDADAPRLDDRPLLFFFERDDATRRSQLRALYPDGQERIWREPNPERNWGSYYVPR